MTSVSFAIDNPQNILDRRDEAAIGAALGDPATGAALAAWEPLKGALIIGGGEEVRVSDDVRASVEKLCFDAVVALAAPGATYEHAFTSGERTATLASGD